MTRQTSARALQHIYDNVLQVDLRDPARYILDYLGVKTLHDLVDIDPSLITPQLVVEVPDNTDTEEAEGDDAPTSTVTLTPVACNQLKSLIAWIAEHEYDPEVTLQLTPDAFTAWRIARASPRPSSTPQTSPPSPAPNTNTSTTTPVTTDLSTSFTKTIKRSGSRTLNR